MKSKTLPGFAVFGDRPIMVMHTFEVTSDGQLRHLTDGILRAIVPPEGWADYCKTYPDAQDIVDELTKPVEVAPAVVDVQAQLAAALAEVERLKAENNAVAS